jgi:hypothetical protein
VVVCHFWLWNGDWVVADLVGYGVVLGVLMGTVNIEIWFPAPAAVFGVFIAVVVVYLLYSLAKFIISLWTGA